MLTPACPLLTPKNWSTSCGRLRADGVYGPAAVSPAAISTYGPMSDAAAHNAAGRSRRCDVIDLQRHNSMEYRDDHLTDCGADQRDRS